MLAACLFDVSTPDGIGILDASRGLRLQLGGAWLGQPARGDGRQWERLGSIYGDLALLRQGWRSTPALLGRSGISFDFNYLKEW